VVSVIAPAVPDYSSDPPRIVALWSCCCLAYLSFWEDKEKQCVHGRFVSRSATAASPMMIGVLPISFFSSSAAFIIAPARSTSSSTDDKNPT
jgi:hypothetical protein